MKPGHQPRLTTCAALTAACALSLTAAAGPLTFNQVALTGESAPGVADGAAFGSFSFPALNASGDVAFRAELQTGTGPTVTFDNAFAIFGPTSGAGSVLGLIAREDAPAPGVSDGAAFDFFDSEVVLNASGDVAFEADLRTSSGAAVIEFGPDSNDEAIFGPTSGAGSGFGGALGLIARENDLAPGVADGAEFDIFVGEPVLNGSGDVAFEALLRTGTGAAAARRGTGLIHGPPFSLPNPASHLFL